MFRVPAVRWLRLRRKYRMPEMLRQTSAVSSVDASSTTMTSTFLLAACALATARGRKAERLWLAIMTLTTGIEVRLLLNVIAIGSRVQSNKQLGRATARSVLLLTDELSTLGRVFGGERHAKRAKDLIVRQQRYFCKQRYLLLVKSRGRRSITRYQQLG